MVSSRRRGDITLPRLSREGCTLTVKKVSVRLFHGLLDRIFDDCIEGLGCKSKRNSLGIPGIGSEPDLPLIISFGGPARRHHQAIRDGALTPQWGPRDDARTRSVGASDT